MVFNNSATWPELEDQVDKRSLSPAVHVAVMTYASEMFSWYAGSVEADVYFCPERHATYFGSFYMKDIPAMGNDNYSISTSLTGDSGEAFLAALTDSQRTLITNLVNQQRQDLNEIVQTRRAISTELRRFMKEDAVDKDKVLSLSRRYGELDGEISYHYATAFAQVAKTLTADQKKTLLRLRNLDAKYTSKGAYLFSGPIVMPEVRNTDFLFGTSVPSKGGSSPAAGNLASTSKTSFVLRSPAVAEGSQLPVEFTGDGGAATLPLEWSGAPAGAKSFALIMHHVDPQGATKWYWILYNILATVQSLPKNVKGVGVLGNNSVNGRTEYAPPHSQGPGPKTYIYTVYALSSPVQLVVPPAQVNRDVLLATMKDRIVGSAELQVVYTRTGAARESRAGPEQGPSAQQPRPNDSASDGRPPRPGDQGAGGNRGGGRGPAILAENKTPTSPNPGQTVGLFLNTSKAFTGYTLMAPKHNTVTYLIDNEGRVVHQWKSDYEPGQSAYLLENGHLLRAGMLRVQGGTGGGGGGRIEEYDWDGNLVWEFNHATRDYQLHHDFKPMPNGHVLALMVERKSLEQAAAAGFNTSLLEDDYVLPDAVVEIEPTPPTGGRIVWEWHVWDHLTGRADPATHPELVAPGGTGRGIRAFWNHMNSLGYNAKLDQIALSVRGNSEVWIIDHNTTTAEAAGHTGGRYGKGGDLLYRWGNPAMYRAGTASDRKLYQQHDARWIDANCPGAGNITVFNNGLGRNYSTVDEWSPSVDANGFYTQAVGLAFGPADFIWTYKADPPSALYSGAISAAQRLPNGNTLICDGVHGVFLEVTTLGETVWRYVNPVVRTGPLVQGSEIPPDPARAGEYMNAVFKVHRYAPDYPGLSGRDLTPKGTVEL